MSRFKKLLERIKNNPKEVRFKELDKILSKLGFTRRQPSGGSSHYIFSKGEIRIIVPYNQPHVKAIYVERVIQILEGEINNE